MALKYGFFDASYDEQTGRFDRQYFSEDMSKFFNAIVGNGIFKNDRDALEVVANGFSMSVLVSTGYATALGRYIDVTEPYELTLVAPSENSKIDLIVARMSTASNERNFTLIVKEGTPSAAPVPPTLVRNSSVYELCLAKVTLTSNTVLVTQELVEDTRADKELCGFVSGLGGGDGAGFMDCTINTGVSTYSASWLLDENGEAFEPEEKVIYRVISSGKYEDCLYVFNEELNTYTGVGSYSIELSADEVRALWGNTQVVRLENVPAPTGSVQYDGIEKSPTWLYYDPTQLRMYGTTSAVNAGNYYASFQPINGYTWADGSVSVKNVMWTISKKLVPIPIPLQTHFNYDGTQKEVVFNNLDTQSVTLTNSKATNTGTYNVLATLNDTVNTCWTDGTTIQRAWQYEIVGNENVVTLSKSTVTFNASTDTDTVTVSSSSGGAITVESTDETIVSASVNGNTITLVPSTALIKGTASVIVTVDGGASYVTGTATITVNKNYGITFVSWADGSDADILGMIQAADNGDIDLHDYWNVGDERVVRLPAINATGTNSYGSWSVDESHMSQDVTLVLMDTDHYELTTPVLDTSRHARHRCSFVVGVKNMFVEYGRIQRQNESQLYNLTDRSTWLNTAFVGALPSSLAECFKSFRLPYNVTGGNPGYMDALFSIFSCKEITGVAPTGRTASGALNSVLYQIEYYKDADNRIKKRGDGNENAGTYWTRDNSLSTTYKIYGEMYASGAYSENGKDMYGTSGISPFGCI